MKVQIECDSGAEELQVLIRCRELDDQVKEIQQALSTIGKCRQQFVFYKGDTEFYMPLNEVLFMETDGNAIQVHTRMIFIRPDINCMSWKNCCRDSL